MAQTRPSSSGLGTKQKHQIWFISWKFGFNVHHWEGYQSQDIISDNICNNNLVCKCYWIKMTAFCMTQKKHKWTSFRLKYIWQLFLKRHNFSVLDNRDLSPTLLKYLNTDIFIVHNTIYIFFVRIYFYVLGAPFV